VTAYPPPLSPVPPDSPITTQRFGTRAMRWRIIAQLVREEGWTRGVEIGTADGRCTEAVLEACPDLHLTTVDVWAAQPEHTGPETWANWPHDMHENRARIRLKPFADRCTIIKGYSKRAAMDFADEAVDFVFLDGDHGEYGVRADILAWRDKIRPGGMLLGHDAAWPGVRAAIDALCPGYWIGPNDVWGVPIPA
jgi:predicted O-methyltransferase YrrM